MYLLSKNFTEAISLLFTGFQVIFLRILIQNAKDKKRVSDSLFLILNGVLIFHSQNYLTESLQYNALEK
mgnify:CR=1 FL=1